MTIRCLLWDFGDTLCDERFIWGSGPEWMAIYDTFDDGIGERWCTDELDTARFADELSNRMERPTAEIIAHMVERSTNHIHFFDYTYGYFRAKKLPQAIVTVNPDLFSEVIAPAHDLAAVCDTIVTSWEAHTVDKSILCSLAIDRMPIDLEPHEALLIDNKQANVDAWIAVGGAGYLYSSDSVFRRDVENGAIGIPQA